MPAARITSPQRLISLASRASSSAGVLAESVLPPGVNGTTMRSGRSGPARAVPGSPRLRDPRSDRRAPAVVDQQAHLAALEQRTQLDELVALDLQRYQHVELAVSTTAAPASTRAGSKGIGSSGFSPCELQLTIRS